MEEDALLHPEERSVLEQGTTPRRRALALLYTVDLAESLGMSNEATAEMVGNMRERLEAADPDRAKKIYRSLAKTAELLDGLMPIPTKVIASDSTPMEVVAKEEVYVVPDEVPVEAATVEPAIAKVDQIGPEPSIEIQEADVPERLSPLVEQFLSRMIGEDRSQELTVDDAPVIAEVLVSSVKIIRTYQATDYRAVLERYFRNESRTSIAKDHSASRHALDMTMSNFVKRFKAANDPADSNRLLFARLNGAESETADIHEAEATPETQPEETERSLVDRIIVTEQLDGELAEAFRSYLDPNGSAVMSDMQQKVPSYLVEYVNRKFGTIDNTTLNLRDEQKVLLRSLTGAWYRETNGGTTHRQARNVTSVLGMSKGRPAELKQELLKGALNLIFSESGDGETLVAEIIKQGLPENQANAIWNQLHFHEGDYTTDNDEAREAAGFLLKRLSVRQSAVLDSDTIMKMGVKMFVLRGLGFNNLDVIYERLHKKDPSLTRDDVQAKIVTGIKELLK